MKISLTKLITASIIAAAFSLTTQAAPIDLNTWTQEGPLGNGNWTVSGPGDSVYQSINGNPTYFVSPESFINKEFNGSFIQNGSAGYWDNDYVGFVFGYNGLDDYYLFDWKQGNQGAAKEGFGLYKISAGTKNFWDHTGTGITTLATNQSTTNGWVDNTLYDFSLGYTDTAITISLDGDIFNNETVIDVAGLTNSAGRFGFYNYSQQAVTYSGFEEDTCQVNCGVGVAEPASIMVLGLGLIGIAVFRRRKVL
ncbi:PEP-CTERM sorting domain-containing protein [Psychromonas aquimarina]|uniref:PEP-CTERM sorting domain-containing protein n=1 Tax=Psychromonas aquimarina TaxID=444919 RepID=UPI000407CAE6|nr:PEP-CTERM sorting domain-containing protein [Psychromonas aquimarina]